MIPSAFRTRSKRAAREIPPAAYRRFVAESPHRPSSRPRQSGGSTGQVYKCGETVRDTGIYEVMHDRSHRQAHEVVMLARDSFPPCETCEARVRFRLVRTAPYIFQDEDFENPDE